MGAGQNSNNNDLGSYPKHVLVLLSTPCVDTVTRITNFRPSTHCFYCVDNDTDLNCLNLKAGKPLVATVVTAVTLEARQSTGRSQLRQQH